MTVVPPDTGLSLSVVMGTFNGARFIEAQIRSIQAQDVLPHELIVADDGSTDDTIAVVERLMRDSPVPIRLVRNPENLGFGNNFMAASAVATGAVIAFCDQDDVWRPDKARQCLARFADPQVVLCVHRARLIDDAGDDVGAFTQGITEDRTVGPLAYDPWGVFFGFTMIFRRTLIEIVDPAERCRDYITGAAPLAHDRWILLLANLLGRTCEIAEDLVGYRQHDANVYGAGRSRRGKLDGVLASSLHYTDAARETCAMVERLAQRNLGDFPLFDAERTRWFWRAALEQQVRRGRVYRSRTIVDGGWVLAANVATGVYRAVADRRFGLRGFAKDAGFLLARSWLMRTGRRLARR